MTSVGPCLPHYWLRWLHSAIFIVKYVWISPHTNIFLLCLSNDIPVTVSMLTAPVLVLMPLSNTRHCNSLEKWLILGLQKEVFKMSLQHLLAPWTREVVKYNRNHHKKHNPQQQRYGKRISESALNDLNDFRNKNKWVFDYNPNYKISMSLCLYKCINEGEEKR
jgi:hypothetical protein